MKRCPVCGQLGAIPETLHSDERLDPRGYVCVEYRATDSRLWWHPRE